MKFKPGEFVRFVEEKREGYITRIIDDQTIAVTDDDGFEIPVLASQVTRVHGHESPVDTTNDMRKPPQQEFISRGIFLAVQSDKKIRQVVRFHLVNKTSFELMCVLISEDKGKYRGEFRGIVEPTSGTIVYTASLPEIDRWPKIHIQLLRFSSEPGELSQPIEFTEKFRAKDFSGKMQSVEFVDGPCWVFEMDPVHPVIDPEKLRESFFKPEKEKQGIDIPGREIDLHIEKIRPDHQFLNPSVILNIQLDHFRKKLDAAIVHRISPVIFIHGTGNGTLRSEIHKSLGKHPQVRTFKDAYKEKFGYGATEVILK